VRANSDNSRLARPRSDFAWLKEEVDAACRPSVLGGAVTQEALSVQSLIQSVERIIEAKDILFAAGTGNVLSQPMELPSNAQTLHWHADITTKVHQQRNEVFTVTLSGQNCHLIAGLDVKAERFPDTLRPPSAFDRGLLHERVVVWSDDLLWGNHAVSGRQYEPGIAALLNVFPRLCEQRGIVQVHCPRIDRALPADTRYQADVSHLPGSPCSSRAVSQSDFRDILPASAPTANKDRRFLSRACFAEGLSRNSFRGLKKVWNLLSGRELGMRGLGGNARKWAKNGYRFLY
jgi:hypothetical protein